MTGLVEKVNVKKNFFKVRVDTFFGLKETEYNKQMQYVKLD